MSLEVISVGSSSSGNSYIIKTGGRAIVLDAGLSCIKIIRALESVGLDTSNVGYILITHEHSDHIQSVKTIANKCRDALVYASCGTIEGCAKLREIDEDRIVVVEAGRGFSDGDIGFRPYALSHDAREPVGYSIISGGKKLSIVTDTGIITDDIYNEISDSDMLVLEANHDEHLLMYGAYPYALKMRIKSDDGHLSNRAAGELLADILRERMERDSDYEKASEPYPVMLAHLSFHNNTPFQARSTVEEILGKAGFERDAHYTLTIASKDEMTVINCGD